MIDFELVSDWSSIDHGEITEEMKEYTREEDWIQPYFIYNGEVHWLSDFVRCHDNPWGGIEAPDYIHGCDASNVYVPLFIEIDGGGENVRVYKSKCS